MAHPNKTKLDPAGRGDAPSGRQASDQPEHEGNADQSSSSLHQGQGPDFQTQDSTLNKKNKGVEQIERLKDTEDNDPEKEPDELSSKKQNKP